MNPTVSGRMEMTHADFQHACAVAIADLQECVAPDNSLIHLLCEAIRCSRELEQFVTMHPYQDRMVIEPTKAR